ncbi:MAG: 6-pyruvoyl tetrahydrobiopterin synthase [Candidatus Eisenbacteria bacterium]|nr:6-pyruvoyl tetrahydrobiopterin synthase [Candidatus Latescibacterota bacterium]MBD3302114.1 6-pyruvoyl tetrahydrobiopterin synthase [Candidatus Eisenbacteria bacterium]
MYRITREFRFSYGHRLLGYEGKCARIHGHDGLLRVILERDRLDGTGMVTDFTEVKRIVSGWIDETFDHRLILHRDDPAVEALRAIDEPIAVVDFNPTAENLARHIFESIRAKGLPVVEVSLDETPSCSAGYRSGDGG